MKYVTDYHGKEVSYKGIQFEVECFYGTLHHIVIIRIPEYDETIMSIEKRQYSSGQTLFDKIFRDPTGPIENTTTHIKDIIQSAKEFIDYQLHEDQGTYFENAIGLPGVDYED